MKLTVNGAVHEVESPPLTTLLAVLREELGITSPKVGCEQGGCGACTVLVGGEPRRACLLPLAALDGAEVTTVEGLGTPEQLGRVQQAFLDRYAAQCGYCTSGMIMAGVGLLKKNPKPSRDEIVKHMDRNVCRCGTYQRIVKAIEIASGTSKEARK